MYKKKPDGAGESGFKDPSNASIY